MTRRIFTEKVTCDVCGGPGVARKGAKEKHRAGAKLRHSDPRECRRNLKGGK